MRRRRNFVWFVGLVGVLSLAVVPIASAHTGGLTAGLDCNGVVSWMVTSDGFDGHFTVSDGSGPQGSGVLNAADSFKASGTFTIPTSVTSDTVTANITWDDGFVGGEPGPVIVTRPTNCGPPPAAGMCHETVNPAGNPDVGFNGFPNDPFGGAAVPGGKDTSPGTNGNGPVNSDGFYLVGGLLFVGTTPLPFPGGGFVWPDNTTIKYTQWGNPNIKISTNIGGPGSVIEFHIQGPDDLYAGAPKGSPGAIFCGVPPPPF
jgi:hypothetical protein